MDTNRGMCANAFGGYARLDKLEVSELAGGKCTGEELIYRAVIVEALNCYLWFGLGRNGFGAQEFLWATDYLFNTTGSDTTSWNPERRVQVSDVAYGCGHGKNREYVNLTDDEMKAMCFDEQYELSGLGRSMTIRRFRNLLMDKRRTIVKDNQRQISEYLRSLRDKAGAAGEYLRAGCVPGSLTETLVSPTDESLASLLYAPRPVAREAHRSPFRLPPRQHGRRMRIPINQYQRSVYQRNLTKTL